MVCGGRVKSGGDTPLSGNYEWGMLPWVFIKCHTWFLDEVSVAEGLILFFQQDEDPHKSGEATGFLNNHFQNNWIGNNVKWSPQSLDLTPMDFCFAGYVKGELHGTQFVFYIVHFLCLYTNFIYILK